MISVVNEYLREIGYDEVEATHVWLSSPASLYISGNFAQTLAVLTKNDAAILAEAWLCILQQIVVKAGFHSSEKGSRDDFIVHEDDEDGLFLK